MIKDLRYHNQNKDDDSISREEIIRIKKPQIVRENSNRVKFSENLLKNIQDKKREIFNIPE